jgi:DNA (cytosine-5)-methyltransferase 1
LEKRFAEFFAGIGLVRSGLQGGGWQCAYANDINPKKREMYEGQFGRSAEYHCESIWNIDRVLERLPRKLSLATASFPCIDLSIAGHWRGLDGEHSSTFFGFLDVLRSLGGDAPPVILLENVIGFIKSRNGKDFARACESIAGLGYWLDAVIVDAKWFVPQSRPRVFLLGIRDSLRGSPVFDRSDELFRGEIAAAPSVLRPASLLSACRASRLKTGWVQTRLPSPPKRTSRLADYLLNDDGLEWWAKPDVDRHLDLMQVPSRARLSQLVDSETVTLGTAFRRTRLGKPRTEVRFDMAGCLRTPKGGSARQLVVRVGRGKIDLRWMTAHEYAGLQGIPDFKITVPPVQAMYGFGDAVCVPAIEWLDRHVLSPLVAPDEKARTTQDKGARSGHVLFS